MFRPLRPLGVGWTVRRLTGDTMADLARIAASQHPGPRLRFESRMYDRINALFARLDPTDPEQRATMQGGLACLRLGLNMLGLKRAQALATGRQAPAIEVALAALRRTFAALARHASVPSPLPALDDAKARLLAAGPALEAVDALVLLDGIHTSLVRHPGFFALPPTAAPASARPLVPA